MEIFFYCVHVSTRLRWKQFLYKNGIIMQPFNHYLDIFIVGCVNLVLRNSSRRQNRLILCTFKAIIDYDTV